MKYFARTRISVFKELKPTFQIKVKPNANNQILIPVDLEQKQKSDAIDIDEKPVECHDFLSSFGRCSRMDNKIVKLALFVLEKIKHEKYEEIEKDIMNERISKIEASLENITNKLTTLLNK